jgi:hypothetical protein
MEALCLAGGLSTSNLTTTSHRYRAAYLLYLRQLISNVITLRSIYATVKMPDIEMPDPEELGGNVTKPFKFVTGTSPLPALSRLTLTRD